MPSPSPGESRDDFVDRCMGDSEAVSDFPNEKQRFAFCNSKFEQKANIEKSDGAVISNMSCGCGCDGETDVTAAEYQGKKVTLNKPFRTPGKSKKFGVYTKNEKGNVVLVRFGDPNMEIKRDDPERRKNFRSRHNCDSPGPKWKARYWSCRQWRGGSNVEAAEPMPKDDETHDEYMSRCEAMGYSTEECMKAHGVSLSLDTNNQVKIGVSTNFITDRKSVV